MYQFVFFHMSELGSALKGAAAFYRFINSVIFLEVGPIYAVFPTADQPLPQLLVLKTQLESGTSAANLLGALLLREHFAETL